MSPEEGPFPKGKQFCNYHFSGDILFFLSGKFHIFSEHLIIFHQLLWNKEVSFPLLFSSTWWFQPIWKNISQNGNHSQVGVKIENIWNHHLAYLVADPFKPSPVPTAGWGFRWLDPTSLPFWDGKIHHESSPVQVPCHGVSGVVVASPMRAPKINFCHGCSLFHQLIVHFKCI